LKLQTVVYIGSVYWYELIEASYTVTISCYVAVLEQQYVLI